MATYGELVQPHMTEMESRGLLEIMQCSWSARSWVVQTLTMAKTAIIGRGSMDVNLPAWSSWETILEIDGHSVRAAHDFYRGEVVKLGLASPPLSSMKEMQGAAPE